MLNFLKQNFSKNFNYGVTDQFTLYRIIIVTPKTLESRTYISRNFTPVQIGRIFTLLSEIPLQEI